MDSLVLSVNVTLPLFIMMALGYLLKVLKVVDSELIKKINKLNFKVFLPLMMFNNLYSADISAVWNPTAVIIAASSSFVIFGFGLLIVPKLTKNKKRCGVIVQSLYHSNYSYVGIPVAMSILNSSSAGIAALILAIISPINNSLTVINYEIFRGGKIRPLVMIKRIITNPLIIASVLGIVGMLLNLKFPNVITKTLNSLSNVCTPLALVMLGASFNFKTLTGNAKHLALTSAARLILIPAIGFTVCILCGLRGEALAAMFALFATPVAVVAYTLSQMMDGDSELAAQMIIVQSCTAIVTMFMWVFILSSLSMF